MGGLRSARRGAPVRPSFRFHSRVRVAVGPRRPRPPRRFIGPNSPRMPHSLPFRGAPACLMRLIADNRYDRAVERNQSYVSADRSPFQQDRSDHDRPPRSDRRPGPGSQRHRPGRRHLRRHPRDQGARCRPSVLARPGDRPRPPRPDLDPPQGDHAPGPADSARTPGPRDHRAGGLGHQWLSLLRPLAHRRRP